MKAKSQVATVPWSQLNKELSPPYINIVNGHGHNLSLTPLHQRVRMDGFEVRMYFIEILRKMNALVTIFFTQVAQRLMKNYIIAALNNPSKR